jgi:hypothetical protein
MEGRGGEVARLGVGSIKDRLDSDAG